MSRSEIFALTSEIVSAHVANNNIAGTDLPGFIRSVFTTLDGLGAPAAEEPEALAPAISIRESVQDDHIVCLEDGKKLKMLKRHLRTAHGMTPDDYRAKWGLPSGYPMAAPMYAEKRRDVAVKIGLGRKPTRKKKSPSKKSPR